MPLARPERDPLLSPATELHVALALLERLPLAALVLDHNARIRFANALVVHLFRYAQAELIDQPVELLIAAAPGPLQGMRKDGTRLGLQVTRSEFAADGQSFTLCIIQEGRDLPAMHDLAL